jgi:hypothetical protein
MSEPSFESGPARPSAPRTTGPYEGSIPYPLNQVVAIVHSPEEATAALHALTNGGFLESEVLLASGAEAADRLHATSGHSGLLDRVLRIADRLGVRDEELEDRDEYEQALRNDEFVVRVLALTEERKQRAAELLRQHGARHVHFKGRFTIEEL